MSVYFLQLPIIFVGLFEVSLVAILLGLFVLFVFQSYNGGLLSYSYFSWTGSLSKRLTSTKCTYFRQKLTSALLESAEGGE